MSHNAHKSCADEISLGLHEFKEALQNCQALGRIRHWQSPGMPELEAVSMGGGIDAGSLAVAVHAAFTRDTYQVMPLATRPFIGVKRRFN
ncbi:MAG: hypothetical protein I8H87_02365 [Comamonadaceae bacterium]|jgi:hypothetical protein|nr:hypothetical protein [Comamonadaceae bacterium]